MSLKQVLYSFLIVIWRRFRLKLSPYDKTGKNTLDLTGDRAIEFPWCIKFLSGAPSRVLDIGSVGSPLTGVAWRFGHEVVSIDLRDIEYEMAGIDFVKADITNLDLPDNSFNVILLCSSVEHIGLGRYGSPDITDGDLETMKLCLNWLAPNGKIALTIPVGLDAVVSPRHRIYGSKTLPLLLSGYKVVKKEFWKKNEQNRWIQTSEAIALQTDGTQKPYAIGLYELTIDTDQVSHK